MNPALPLIIQEVLPTEILEMIFEEHAILEWKAPSIDGRVCRLWRQIILNTPRVWAYFEIRDYSESSMREVRLRLHRSNPARLHIDIRAKEGASQRLYNLFHDHHARIASLRMQYGSESFFEGRVFPCLRLLDVAHWYSIRWGSMPKLQSLRLGGIQLHVVPLSELAPLEMLTLCGIRCTSLTPHCQSLTKLMLNAVSLADATSGPLNFPSLTYLSLIGVRGLKPHVNAPRLVTYHEGRTLAGESFNVSLPSLVEYGVYHPDASDLDPTKLHLSFPNIRRLAIRADGPFLLSFFTSLSNQPHLLPALRTISVGGVRKRTGQMAGGDLAEGDLEKMQSLSLGRNEACNGNVVVYFERGAPFEIPIFFGAVSELSTKWSCAFLMHLLVTRSCLLKTLRPQALAWSHHPIYERGIAVVVTLVFISLPLAVYQS